MIKQRWFGFMLVWLCASLLTCGTAFGGGSGACCFADSCQESQSASDCESAGGDYGGDGSTCANTCPGTCCFLSGDCATDVTEDDCTDQGGVFVGQGVACATINCVPRGACCFEFGFCIIRTRALCLSDPTNSYAGDGIACGDVSCAFGACCLPNGDCQDGSTAIDCDGAGGTYVGNGSVCGPSGGICDQGACCFPGETTGCLDLDPESCSTTNGLYQGDGSSCNTVLCVGACCLADGMCELAVPTDCETAGGLAQGEGVPCDSVECPEPPPNDDCADAEVVVAPSTTPGSTFLGALDPVDLCGYQPDEQDPGVWYRMTGTGNSVTALLCERGSDPLSNGVLAVYCGSCQPLRCIGGSDDVDGDYDCETIADFTWCTQPNVEYLILVYSDDGSPGAFDLNLLDDGAPCDVAPPCVTTGACCFEATTCEDGVTEADCTDLGGVYQGDGVPCAGGFVYILESCDSAFEDISATGIDPGFGDDYGEIVPLGFTFDFFGDSHTEIGLASNGYLAFIGTLTAYDNVPIPNPDEPNALIAPLWTDWNPPNSGVQYETRGAVPNRRFVAQWTEIPHLDTDEPSTFQAVLYEGSNCIEFRYAELGAFPFATVGLENQDGTVGYTALASAGTCLRFCPQDLAPVNCAPPGPGRATSTEKGSLLMFSAIELRWSAGPAGGGALLQDTFISLTNDYPEDVDVQMYLVNGDPPLPAEPGERAHPGWNYVDNGFTLTGDQPTYWSALTGLPATGGVAPMTALDPGFPPGRPANDGTGDRVLRGFLIVWAVNADNQEIRWNHLKGEATIVDYGRGCAWEYGSVNYRVVDPAIAQGQPTGTPGVLNLDGNEYEQSFAQLLMNFQVPGASAFSGPRQVISDTLLALHPASADLRQGGDGPVTTKADFNTWNMNEVKFSEMHRCITCWDATLLSRYGIPNNFVLEHLQTPHGKVRIDGLASQFCNVDAVFDDGDCGNHPGDVCSIASPLLGVVTRLLTYDGGMDHGAAAANLVGMGLDGTAVIRYDVLAPPPEGVMPSTPLEVIDWLERQIGARPAIGTGR